MADSGWSMSTFPVNIATFAFPSQLPHRCHTILPCYYHLGCHINATSSNIWSTYHVSTTHATMCSLHMLPRVLYDFHVSYYTTATYPYGLPHHTSILSFAYFIKISKHVIILLMELDPANMQGGIPNEKSQQTSHCLVQEPSQLPFFLEIFLGSNGQRESVDFQQHRMCSKSQISQEGLGTCISKNPESVFNNSTKRQFY